MRKKDNRLSTIIEIINSKEISGQDQLLTELSKCGITITQATLSRNLKELSISKIANSDGRYVYTKHLKEFPKPPILNHFSLVGYKSINFSGNMGIIKTNPGYASMIASELDKKFEELILGTIAGDDTIFFVIKDGVRYNDVNKKLNELIPKIG